MRSPRTIDISSELAELARSRMREVISIVLEKKLIFIFLILAY